MTSKRDKEFFKNLSRKDMQILCKNYGLPANRSTCEMAESLFSYSKKQSRARGGASSSSLTAHLRPGMPSKFTKNAEKDGYGLIFCPSSQNNGMSKTQSMICNEMCCCGGHGSNYKARFGASSFNFKEASPQLFHQFNGNKVFPTTSLPKEHPNFVRDGKAFIPQIQHRDHNVAGCPDSLLTTSTIPSPSFEFHVSSSEGLNLCVDLNSSPSDWIRELQKGVNICDNMCHEKPENFQQELGRLSESSKQTSFIMTTDTGENKDDLSQAGCSSRSFSKDLSCEGFNNFDAGHGSVMSSAINPSDIAADGMHPLEEDQGVTSLEAISTTKDHVVSISESATKDRGIINLDTDAAKSGGDSVAILSDGSTSIVTLENKPSKHDHETCENSIMPKHCNVVNSGALLTGSLGSVYVGKRLSRADEFHCGHSTSSPFRNDRFLDLVDPLPNTERENGDLASSSKLHDTCGNDSPRCIDVQERNKIGNEEDDSECSQSDGLLEDSSLMTDNLESKGETCKKRACLDIDDDSDYARSDTRILRSKTRAEKVFPRRSKRLVSK